MSLNGKSVVIELQAALETAQDAQPRVCMITAVSSSIVTSRR